MFRVLRRLLHRHHDCQQLPVLDNQRRPHSVLVRGKPVVVIACHACGEMMAFRLLDYKGKREKVNMSWLSTQLALPPEHRDSSIECPALFPMGIAVPMGEPQSGV